MMAYLYNIVNAFKVANIYVYRTAEKSYTVISTILIQRVLTR